MAIQARLVIVTCLLGAAAWFGAAAGNDVEVLWSPAASNSWNGTLVRGGDGELYLSWIEPESHLALKYSSWEHGEWGPAETVAEGNTWSVSPVDVPGMTVVADGTILAHWLAVIPGRAAETIRMTYSVDGGRTWSDPLALPGEETGAWRGLVSWAPLYPDRAAFVWCESSGAQTESDQTGDPPTTMLQFSTLSSDQGFSEPVLLDSNLCGICAPDLARVGDESLVVAYRSRSGNGDADIRCRCFDGTTWTESRPVHGDGWAPPSCPVNGPAVDAVGNDVAVTWLTEDEEGQARVRVAFSTDGGRIFSPPIAVTDGGPIGRPDVALMTDGSAWVVWLEPARDNRSRALVELRVRTVSPDGDLGDPMVVAETGQVRESLFPHLMRLGEEVYIVWTQAAPLNAAGGAVVLSEKSPHVRVAKIP